MPLTRHTSNDFQQRMQRIEGLIHRLEAAADSETRNCALELMQSLMELHGAGLDRLLEIIAESGETGLALIDELGRDELVSGLLLLYGLHPADIETRVLKAPDQVRPYLQSHGGNVELLAVTEGIVRLRLRGTCNGCASSAETLRQLIEEAIFETAPDVAAIEVEGVTAKAQAAMISYVQLECVPRGN
ncbi:MAG TPA: NifU family protein [Blastocatellia bacterium]|nr:NifU family protein [Blastocatellia bacterium]